MPDSNFIELKNIKKNYGKYTALHDINLNIKKGEFLCILGPSGCGKTTLLRIIAGLEKPTEGKMYLNGKDARKMKPGERNFGIVFQSYALFPNMTVKQNISFALENKKISKQEIVQKTEEYIKKVNLKQQAERYPSELSGGQQQRTALARALVTSPDFLLLDEPLSALDAKVRIKMRKEIKALQEETGITTIMVTHDQDEALAMADRIVVMNNSCISQIGTPEEIYENPANPFVADFIGEINFFENDRLKSDFTENPDIKSQNEIKAIRPENIEIPEKADDYCIKAEVIDTEYHGSNYRVVIKLLDNKYKDEYENIVINVSGKIYKEKQIKKGSIIKVKLYEEKFLYYNQLSEYDYKRDLNSKLSENKINANIKKYDEDIKEKELEKI